jgi:hypothetical protein
LVPSIDRLGICRWTQERGIACGLLFHSVVICSWAYFSPSWCSRSRFGCSGEGGARERISETGKIESGAGLLPQRRPRLAMPRLAMPRKASAEAVFVDRRRARQTPCRICCAFRLVSKATRHQPDRRLKLYNDRADVQSTHNSRVDYRQKSLKTIWRNISYASANRRGGRVT